MTALVTLWAGGFLAMLDDGTRVISHRGLYRLLGLSERAAGRRADKNPRFLGSKALSPFVSAALLAPTRNPISYRTHGGRTAAAYALNHIRHNHNPVDGDVVGAVVLDGERELLHAFDELH